MELCPAEERCIKSLPWQLFMLGKRCGRGGEGGLERVVGLFVIGFQVFAKKIIHQVIALVNNSQTTQLLTENMLQEQLWYFSAQSSCFFVKQKFSER